VHIALVSAARFVLDLRVGSRSLAMATQLAAGVAMHWRAGDPLLLTVDDHRPYPRGNLQVFGQWLLGRRKRGRGRRKLPRLQPSAELLVGVVTKVRDASGRRLSVRTRNLFGTLKGIRAQMSRLDIGCKINTSHIERLNGTIRSQQTRLARRTRNVSRKDERLVQALTLWRDWYKWSKPHASLGGDTPAMKLGLSERIWSVPQYVTHPVHVGALQREIWQEEYENIITDGVNRQKRPKTLPTS